MSALFKAINHLTSKRAFIIELKYCRGTWACQLVKWPFISCNSASN